MRSCTKHVARVTKSSLSEKVGGCNCTVRASQVLTLRFNNLDANIAPLGPFDPEIRRAQGERCSRGLKRSVGKVGGKRSVGKLGGVIRYCTVRASQVLTLRFNNLDANIAPLGPFDPEIPKDISPNVHLTDPTAYVSMKDATQALCGYLFMELWSNDMEGFPVPKGCFYSPVQQDFSSSIDLQMPRYRDVGIIFAPNQLKSSCTYPDLNSAGKEIPTNLPCEYQFVFNAKLREIPFADPTIKPISMFVTYVLGRERAVEREIEAREAREEGTRGSFFGGSRPARGDKDHTIGGGEEGVAGRRCEGVHGGGAGSGGSTSGAEGRVWRAVTGRGPTWGERWCRGARVRAAEGAARFSPASSFGSLFVRSDCLSERLRESLFGRMSVGLNGRCSTGRRLVRHV